MIRPLVSLALIGAAAPALAQTLTQVSSYEGRSQFVLVGASLTDNEGLNNGVNCLKTNAAATVFASDLPARPKLVKATLYVGGSLIDDGLDAEGLSIFDNGDLRADNSGEEAQVLANARAAADTQVSFWPPGAANPITVSATPGSSYASVLYKTGGAEEGNFGFFVTPFDVTSVLADEGEGELAGTYIVGGVRADVCLGLEATCSTDPAAPTCVTQAGSQIHTNGAASWALLLVLDDPSLPLRSITTFEGLLSLSGSSETRMLSLPNPISDPASGLLAFYALEGDLTLPSGVNTSGPCSADEYIEVDGDDDPTASGLCLSDDDNPTQNLFNGTINVQPDNGAAPECTANPGEEFQCCQGDGLCGVVGVDIDRFNISSALVPGASDVRVTIGTGQDRIYVATVVVGVEVFQPVLNVDTQVRVLTADEQGYVRLGDDIVYSIAISNTGNELAQDVAVLMDAPALTEDFTLLALPDGANDQSNPTGGPAGTGRVHVSGFDVPPGEVAEIRLLLRSSCAIGISLSTTASVTALGVPTFQVAAPTVTLAGPGIEECDGLDPDGPFRPELIIEPRELRGGGCNTVAGSSALVALAALLLRARRRNAREVRR